MGARQLWYFIDSTTPCDSPFCSAISTAPVFATCIMYNADVSTLIDMTLFRTAICTEFSRVISINGRFRCEFQRGVATQNKRAGDPRTKSAAPHKCCAVEVKIFFHRTAVRAGCTRRRRARLLRTFILYSIVLHFGAEARPFRDTPIYSKGRSTSVAGRGRLA